MDFAPATLLIVAAIGLTAGTLGGLAGIGGSLVMLPALGLLLGYRDAAHTDQHLYMGAAMCVNFLVALPAALRHARAGAMRRDLVRLLLPSMAAAMVLGVLISNQAPGELLRRLLAAFIALYCAINLVTLARRLGGKERGPERRSPGLMVAIGTAAGLVAGILGLGGGVVMVPLMQVFARVPLRNAIAVSCGVMCITSALGAAIKVSTLPELGLGVGEALTLAGIMAPGAMLGAMLGATLTHALPLPWVRGLISAALLAAAAKLAGIF